MNELIQKLSHACQSGSSREKIVFHAALYDTLFDKVYPIAYRFSSRDADDITAEIFLKFFELDLKLLLKHKDYLEKYLLKSAIYFCISYTKRNLKHKHLTINENLDSLDKLKNKLDPKMDFKLDFSTALQVLKSDELKIFKLILQGFNYKEIAEKFQISEDAVKKRVQRGKRKIKTFFKNATI